MDLVPRIQEMYTGVIKAATDEFGSESEEVRKLEYQMHYGVQAWLKFKGKTEKKEELEDLLDDLIETINLNIQFDIQPILMELTDFYESIWKLTGHTTPPVAGREILNFRF